MYYNYICNIKIACKIKKKKNKKKEISSDLVSSWQAIDCHRDRANLQVEIDLRVYSRLGKLRIVNTACVPSVFGKVVPVSICQGTIFLCQCTLLPPSPV